MSSADIVNIGDWTRFDMAGIALPPGACVDRVLAGGKVIGEQTVDASYNNHFEMPHRTYDDSVLAVTNEAGTVIRQEEFMPYGVLTSDTTANGSFFEQHFQGNRADKLMVAGTRAYDMNGGMWLARDPLALNKPEAVLSDSRLVGMYQFDFGNPLRYTDPNGNDPDDPRDAPDVYHRVDDPQQVVNFHSRIGRNFASRLAPAAVASAPLIVGSAAVIAYAATEAVAAGGAVALPVVGRAAAAGLTRLTVAAGALMNRVSQCGGGVEQTGDEAPANEAATSSEVASVAESGGADAEVLKSIAQGRSMQQAVQQLNAAGATQSQAISAIQSVVANVGKDLYLGTVQGAPGTTALVGVQFVPGGVAPTILVAPDGVATFGSGVANFVNEGIVISGFEPYVPK